MRRARRVRRRRSARAGRARPAGAGAAGDPVRGARRSASPREVQRADAARCRAAAILRAVDRAPCAHPGRAGSRRPRSRSPTSYAPEHLILADRASRARWLERVHSAGSVFLGDWSPETDGRLLLGTNHVLPTYGYARAYSGLSVEDFVKRITVQELTPAGLAGLGPTAQRRSRGSRDSTRTPRRSIRLRRARAASAPVSLARSRSRGPRSARSSPTRTRRGSPALDAPACERAAVARRRAMRTAAGLNRYPEPQPHALIERAGRALRRAGRPRCSPAAAATRPSIC